MSPPSGTFGISTLTKEGVVFGSILRPVRLAREDGQTMAEYAVILAVIAIGVIVAITALSGGISDAIDKVTSVLP
jgi:Flp pilus assembly pilin Flp